MSEPVFDDEPEDWERELHAKGHELKHALKQMEHNMKQAERDRKNAIKFAMKRETMGFGDAAAGQGPRSVDEVLVEVDSYLSYLEDLPKEKLAPYGDAIERLAEHLDKVRRSLKKE